MIDLRILRLRTVSAVAVIAVGFCPRVAVTQDEKSYLSMEALGKAVVYLEGEKQRVTKVEGREYELGIRTAGERQFIPWTEPVSGTGFIVKAKEHVFLVTADHVGRALMGEVTVTFLGEEGRPRAIALQTLLGAASGSEWISHNSADVSARRLEPSEPLKSELLDRAIPIHFIEDSLTYPAAEYPLIVVGFPLGLGVSQHFSPLRRDTNAASGLISLTRPDNGRTETFFLLQDPSIGGYSGAPVFTREAQLFGSTVLAGVTADGCMGLVHGTISDNTGGKLTAVVPAHFIIEVLNALAGGGGANSDSNRF